MQENRKSTIRADESQCKQICKLKISKIQTNQHESSVGIST